MPTGITGLIRFLVLGRREGYRARVRRRVFELVRGGRPADRSASAPPAAATASPRVPPPEGFHLALAKTALRPGEVTEVIVAGTAVAVCNVNGTFFAVSNVCPHAGGPIGDGTLEEHKVTCPYHGWSYDVRDGRCFVNKDVTLPRYDVQVIGDEVFVRV